MMTDDRQGLLREALDPDVRERLERAARNWHDTTVIRVTAGDVRAALTVAQVPAQDGLRATVEKIVAHAYDATDGCRWCGTDYGDGHTADCGIPALDAALLDASLALPAQEERLDVDPPETWRDEGIIEALRTGKPLGSFARARLLEMVEAPAMTPDPILISADQGETP